jgi:hypothetical protein
MHKIEDYSAEDFISGDWVVDLQYPEMPLQVLYPMDDGLRLKHSFTWDENSKPVRLDIPSKIDYSMVGLIQIDRSIMEKIGFKDDGMYAFIDLGDQKYAKYYHYLNRFEVIWEGIDDRANNSYQRDVIFCATCKTVDQLHHVFKMANINIEIKL